MKVLGISPLDKDSTVTLVEDGVITYAAAEERFTRVKLQDGFPWQALGDALERTGTAPEDIDRVVYPFLTWDEETRLFERNLANEREFLDEAEAARPSDALREAQARVPCGPAAGPGARRSERADGEGLAEDARLSRARERGRRLAQRRQARLGAVGPRGVGVSPEVAARSSRRRSRELGPRRQAQARRASRSATRPTRITRSGFDEALIVTLDGYGSGLAGSVSVGRGGTIERVARPRVSRTRSARSTSR